MAAVVVREQFFELVLELLIEFVKLQVHRPVALLARDLVAEEAQAVAILFVSRQRTWLLLDTAEHREVIAAAASADVVATAIIRLHVVCVSGHLESNYLYTKGQWEGLRRVVSSYFSFCLGLFCFFFCFFAFFV